MSWAHSNCGAIKGACDKAEMGFLTDLLYKIRPAVNEETETTGDRSSANKEFVDNVTLINVRRMAREISQRSSIIRTMVENGEAAIIGGIHNIATGEVTFLEDTWQHK